jgi:phosphohistidine swiveling domain-containing protein
VRMDTTRPVVCEYACSLEHATDEALVGGKAWNLSRMMRLGVRVPSGFVVTDNAYQLFIDQNRLRSPIREIIDTVNPKDLRTLQRAAASIREIAGRAGIPHVVRDAVLKGYGQIGSGRTVIVRSSAVGEDSKSASFAGQLDSCRDICSAADVEEALVQCWLSSWSTRALHYQLSRGTRIEKMGVVVQEQVRPKAAGVFFTVSPDPALGAGEMVGEYCLGHGENLVSGRIDPGRFTVSRDGCRCIHLAEPDQSESGLHMRYRIDEKRVQTLRQIGLLLEREFQGAQDIEWAIDHDEDVHIVQSRPITIPVIGPKTRPDHGVDAEASPVVWSNANINENYPDPVSPFLYSMARDGYYHYFRNLALAFGISKGRIGIMEESLRGIIGVHGARLYYNLSNIHAALRMAPFGEQLVESFNVFVGTKERTSRSSQRESFSGRSRGKLAQAAELVRIILKTAWQFLFLERRVASFEKTADGFASQTRPTSLQQSSLRELHTALRSFLEIRFHRWTNASLADAASMMGYGVLKHLIGRAFPDSEHAALHNTLLQGLPDLISARPVIELWKLSRTIRTDPSLRDLFTNEKNGDILIKLRSDKRYAGFLEELERYLENWGFRCSGELMLSVKSFQEDPKGVLSLLKNYAGLDEASPQEALLHQSAQRLAATGRVLNHLRQRKIHALLPWPRESTAVALVLRWTQAAIALRERARLKQSLLYSRCRRILLRMGEELVSRDRIHRTEDVFFLTYQELSSLVCGSAMFPYSIGALVDLRRREHEKLCMMTPLDSFVLPEGAYLFSQDTADESADALREDEGVMTGTGACGGRVTSRAVVLSDVSESGNLVAGDILVTRQTDPGWAPLFFLVSGLVMERGGMLSHGAIIAREYGIPTVVGVREATKRIRSGHRVSVDGDTGRVRLVD